MSHLIKPMSTLLDYKSGNFFLSYRSGAEKKYLLISPAKHLQWKRWLFRKRDLDLLKPCRKEAHCK